MCRHLGYLGPALRLSEITLDPPHSLRRQAHAPAEMRGGATVNADGFGIGWFSADGAVTYRRSVPLWADANVDGLCRATRAPAAVAAVRSATPGMPLSEGACAPFTDGRWLFSHNGVVTGFPDSVVPLAKRLPARDLMTLPAATDSALLWAVLRAELPRAADPASALASLVTTVAALAPESRLNLLLSDGRRLYATAWGHSLSVLRAPGMTVVASEPYDGDERWRPVAEGTLVVAGAGSATLQPLGR